MSSLKLASPPDAYESRLEQSATDLSAQITSLAIVDARSYDRAAALLVDVKSMLGAIDELCDPSIEAAHKAHVAALAVKKRLTAPLLAAEKLAKTRIASYVEAEELRRREEEARLTEVARKRQEEERLLEAIDVEQAGDKEGAAEILASPVLVPVVTLPAQKPDGVSISKRWSASVVDLKALARAVADGTAPLEAIDANQSFLDRLARTLKTAMNVPGVVVQTETVVSGKKR